MKHKEHMFSNHHATGVRSTIYEVLNEDTENMEKQNRTTKGHRLVGVKTTLNPKSIRRLMLYSPEKGIPIAECERDEDGRFWLIFKKKLRGHEAVYEKITLPDFVAYVVTECL